MKSVLQYIQNSCATEANQGQWERFNLLQHHVFMLFQPEEFLHVISAAKGKRWITVRNVF